MPKMTRPKSLKSGLSSVVKRAPKQDDDQDALKQAEDILEEFGIDLDVKVERGVLTPEAIDSVTFDTTQPWGSHPEQVDDFVNQTKKSIDSYIRLVERKNQDLHRLINEINQSRTDIENYKYQIQMVKAGGVAVVNENGEYVTEEVSVNSSKGQDREALQQEVDRLTEEVQALTEECDDLRAQVEEMTAYADKMEAYSRELEEQLESGSYTQDEQDFVDSQVDDFVGQHVEESEYDEGVVSEDVEALKQQLAEFDAYADKMEADVEELKRSNEELQEQIVQWEEYANQLQEGNSEEGDPERVAELTEELYTLQEQFRTSEKEKSELYDNYQAAIAQNQEYEEHIAQMEEYADQLEKANEKLEDEKKQIRVELDSDRRKTSVNPNAEEDMEAMNTYAAEMKKQNQELEKKLAALQSQLEQAPKESPKKDAPQAEPKKKRGGAPEPKLRFDLDDLTSPEI